MNQPLAGEYEEQPQYQSLTVTPSRSSYMYGMGHEGYIQFQHFIEIGMSTTNWDEVDLGEMAIVAYVQNQNEDFLSIDLSAEFRHYFKRQISVIKPIKKDFNGGIEVEVFSWYLEIPEEIVKIQSQCYIKR